MVSLESLVDDTDRYVREYVVNHPNMSLERLAEMANSKDLQVRKAVASGRNTTAEILDRLSRDRSYKVREAVAENPNTPLATLDALMSDKDRMVRVSAVANPNAVPLYGKYYNSPNAEVVIYIASSNLTPVDVLQKAAEVCPEAVAGNRNAPSSLLRELYEQSYRDPSNHKILLENIAYNLNTPPDILEQLSLLRPSDYPRLIRNIVENPSTPVDVLRRWASNTKFPGLAEFARRTLSRLNPPQ